MRFHEIASGLRVPVSEEEQAILTRLGSGSLAGRHLGGEREQEVARTMLARGLLDRCRGRDGKPAYRVNSVADIWRFR